MAESKAEARIRLLENANSSSELEASYFRKLLEETREAAKSADRELAELRQQHALLLQMIDEQRKRLEKWDTRLWGVVAITIGAVLSLAAGLIVALVKR
jgi:hypothetical protein